MPEFQVTPWPNLQFTGEPGKPCNVQMTLTNDNNAQDAMYKVKTTTPVRYSVKPRIGILPRSGSVSISITYRPAEEEKVQDGRSRDGDKFQVEARLLGDNEREALRQAGDSEDAVGKQWKTEPPATSGKTQKFVLACKFAAQAEAPPPAPLPTGDRGRLSPTAPDRQQEPLHEQLQVLARGIDSEQRDIDRRRKKLHAGISIPLWLAVPVLILAIVAGYLVRQHIPEISRNEHLQFVAQFADTNFRKLVAYFN
eukprot:TRINITY_DN8237_c0_g1_i1.p1 TRINITY_DN8237_c0_g1~~TRINITY_DN8237_c0_g1_i1.p1  ORF type:complete len:286 (+),score=94.85 TRINITY_DN8237_c0_g1_i1:100-858(+)